MSSQKVLWPLSVVYCYLLVISWQPDTLQLMMPGDMRAGLKGLGPQFFPQLRAIQVLFSRLVTAASLWVHIITVNFFFARSIYLEGLMKKIPTQHSCLIALFLGPIAVLSNCLTRVICKSRREESAHPKPQTSHSHHP